MSQHDQIKILAAGFLIIRSRDDQPLNAQAGKVSSMIMCKTKEQNQWHILEKGFASKAARDRRMTELLESETTVQD